MHTCCLLHFAEDKGSDLARGIGLSLVVLHPRITIGSLYYLVRHHVPAGGTHAHRGREREGRWKGGRGREEGREEREGRWDGEGGKIERTRANIYDSLGQNTPTVSLNADSHLPFHFRVFEPPSNIALGGTEGVLRVGHRLHKACMDTV